MKRYIQEKCNVDITSPDFAETNTVFSSKVTQLKQTGKDNVKHKEAIEDDDLLKMYTYFEKYVEKAKINPKILQQKVFLT